MAMTYSPVVIEGKNPFYYNIVRKGGNMFKIHSEYKPTGDQPKAIEYLSKGIGEGKKFQTLLGVTGSRKNIYNGKYNRKNTKIQCSYHSHPVNRQLPQRNDHHAQKAEWRQ